jgi:radical SAM superfamily enzyme YgiQ (UPF0313 family)
MPKLLLLQPPIEDFYDTDIRLQPIGLCYLKAAVHRFCPDFEVAVRDFHTGCGRRTLPYPKELSYLQEYYLLPDRGPFSIFHQYFRFGAAPATVAAEVAREQPDMVGISALFSPYYREVLSCAAAIRGLLSVPIVVGGSHVSCAPETILASPHVDFVIRGEGERPLVELLQAWQQGGPYERVANLGWKRGSEMVFNPMAENFPLPEIPIPDYGDFDPDRYCYEGRPLCMILTSRGCPHRCGFCSVHLTFGHRYRRRSAAAVVAEMEARYAQGIRVFDFEDDNLTFDLGRMKELCQRIGEAFQGRDIQLLAMNGISYKSLDREVLALMRQVGFTHLNLALVSSNEEILTAYSRPHRRDNFSTVVDMAFGLGFRIVAHQIMGLPGESLNSMIDTLVLLARLPLLIGVSIFYLTPGSPVAASFPALSETDIFRSRSTAMAIETRHCQRDDLYTLFLTARILNFLKGVVQEGEETSLADLLGREHGSPRTAAGFTILRRLLAEKRLYAATPKGLAVRRRFDADLFEKIWKNLDWIVTQQGRRIHSL